MPGSVRSTWRTGVRMRTGPMGGYLYSPPALLGLLLPSPFAHEQAALQVGEYQAGQGG